VSSLKPARQASRSIPMLRETILHGWPKSSVLNLLKFVLAYYFKNTFTVSFGAGNYQ
jgi:hypothetical protein